MKKRVCFTMFAIMLLYMTGFTQTKVTFVQNFDGANTFSINPSNSWLVTNSLSASGSNSCLGFIPNNTGDSVVLMTPYYDLTAYGNAYLRFTHICKVAEADIATVEYREDYVGATWRQIPAASYQGTSKTYSKQRVFSDVSYPEWVSADLMAQPTNGWWKTESFDVSQEVSYARVQFRFKIKKGSQLGSQFAWGWFIDNFELIGSTGAIRPPVVQLVEPYVKDTVYSTGPYEIIAKAAKRTLLPLRTPILRLSYTRNGITVLDSSYMNPYEGDSIWIDTIPQKLIGTSVVYSVYATDSIGNDGTAYAAYYIGRLWGMDSNSVALTSIDNPGRGAIAGQSTPVIVSIQNRGLKTLSSAVLNWSVNGVLQTPYNYSGSLAEAFTDQVTIGNYVPRMSEYDTIVVWVGMPNGVSNTTSDTILDITPYGCDVILSGNYTIGSTGDFASVNEALDIIELCGTSGKVTLQLQNGTYREAINFIDYDNILGARDSIVLTSLSGNPNDVTIVKDSTQTMVINIARSHNIIIKNLTLDGTLGTVGVRITDACSNIDINNCIINMDTVSSVTSGGIYKGATTGLVNKLRIYNNVINGAYYGIFIEGMSQTSYNTNVYIANNTIKNSYYYGLYMRYNEFTYITKNTITSRSVNMGTNYYGMYLYYNHGEYITKNRIHSSLAIVTPIGMYIYYLNYLDSVNLAMIANNEIIINVSGAAEDGMTISSTSANIFHNSILRTGQTQGAAIWLINSASILNIYNNNLVTEGGYPIYLAGMGYLGSTWYMDYNNYYSSNGNYVGYAGGPVADMTSWRTTTGQDSNSVSVVSNFYDPTKDLKLLYYTNLNCPVLGMVPYDILDSARVGLTAMGAYTQPKLSFDVASLNALGWSRSATVNQATAVNALFMNVGTIDTIVSLTVNWSVNGVLQTPYNWVGSLLAYETDTVYLGTFLPVNGNNYVKVWISNPNGQATDMNVLNDTVEMSTYGCVAPLSGNYTIGGTGADFLTISEAISIMSYCGLGGPVVFKLASGTYYDMAFTGTYPGTDSVKTVTFTSAADNADSVIFTGITYGLSITNAANLRFHKISVNFFNINYGINITDSCRNIEISHCNIIGDPTTTATRYGIRYYNTTTGSDNIRIIHNTINGGYYGMYIYGASAMRPTRFVVDSNIVTNQYYYGINTYYTNYISISHNVVKARILGANAYWYGMYNYYNDINLIDGNIVHSLSPTVTNPYGMYLQYVNNTVANALVSNNEVIITTSSSYYGIYPSNSNLSIVNNSVLVKGTGAGRALYITSSANNYDVFNNNLITLAAAGAYPIYLGATTYLGTSWFIDYNNYYTNGTYIGYAGGDRNTLALWKGAVSTDINSVNIYPQFLDESLTLTMRLYKNTGLTCPINGSVLYDINANARTSTTSMGAYEFTPIAHNTLVSSFVRPTASISSPGDTLHVEVKIKNKSDSALTSVTVNWSVNNVFKTPYNWTGSLAPGDSTTIYLGWVLAVTRANTIKVYTSQPNGFVDQFPQDDTLTKIVTGCFSTLSGTYTVGPDVADDYNTISDLAIAISNCGMSGPVLVLIDSGTYVDNLVLSYAPGSNLVNTLTITSASGNAADVVIQSPNGDPAISLQGMYGVTIKDITINGLLNNSLPTSIGIQLKGGNRDIIIRDNIINTCGALVNATTLQAILASTPVSRDSMVYIINNKLNGSGAIYLYYGSTMLGHDFTIDSNTITNPYYYGIYTYYVNIRRVNENFIFRDVAMASYCYYGIYCPNSYGVPDAFTTINNNRLHGNFYAAMYITGIYSISSGWAVTKPLIIANNEVILRGTASGYGAMTLWNSGGYTVIANNTFVNDVGSSRPYLFTTYTYNSQHFEVINNNFVNYGTLTSTMIYTNWATQQNYVDAWDYNNYWTGGVNLATWAGGIQATLAAFGVSNNNRDLHSSTVDPQFTLPLTEALPTYWGSMNCPRNIYTQKDIDHQNRDTITYKGAYCPVFDLDASLTAFVTPNTPYVTLGDTVDVEVNLLSLGYDTVRSVTIQWKIDGVLQTPINLTGLSLGRSQSMNVVLGSFVPTVSSNYTYINAWCENPNNLTDRNLGNDTIVKSLLVCGQPLSGTYRVGSSALADFANLDEVSTLLRYCGINGPVTLNLEAGVYSPVTFYPITGSSFGNVVTLTSLSGNPASVTILTTGSTSPITLQGVANMYIRNITLDASTSPTVALRLSGLISNVDVYNCVLKAMPRSSSNTTACVYYNNASGTGYKLDRVRFRKNSMDGGYYNMYLYYTGSGSGTNMGEVVIDSNTLTNAYYYGIYSYYYGYYPSISYNTITLANGASTSYGMYLYYYHTVENLIGNKVNVTATTTAYGIYTYSYSNYSTSYNANGPGMIANNDIYVRGGTTGAYGLYTYTNSKWNIYHNSIYAANGATNYAVYRQTTSTSYPINIERNNLVVANGSSIYINAAANATAGYGTLDYNNYYGPTLANIGGTTHATLTSMRSVTFQDVNSVNINPTFIDVTKSLELSEYDAGLICPRIPSVIRDFKGNQRTVLTIIGAYSMLLYDGFDLTLEQFVEPQLGTVECFPDYTPVKVQLYNKGIFNANFGTTPLTLNINCVSDSATVQTSVTLTSGVLNVMRKDTIELLSMLDITYPGNYAITAWLSSALDTVHSDDTIHLDYYVDKTTMPYDNDFNSPGAGIVTNHILGSIDWDVDSTIVPASVYGDGNLYFRSSAERGSMSQALLTSVELQGNYNPKLIFWYAHDNANPTLRDQMEVRISTDGGATFQILQTIYRYNSMYTTPGWKKYTIDLSPYTSGNCIILSFMAYSYGGGDQIIDRIQLVALEDIEVSLISPDTNAFAACDLSNRSFSVIMNNKTNVIMNYEMGDSITIDVKGPANYKKTYPLYPHNFLDKLDIDTFLVANDFDFSVGGGTYYITAYINSMDSNTMNDTAFTSFVIDPDIELVNVNPIGYKDIGDTVYVSLRIANVGNLPIMTPFDVRLKVSGNNEIVETISQVIGVGDSLDYTFIQGFVVPVVPPNQPYYHLSLKTDMSCDVDTSNNVRTFYGDINVTDLSIYSINNPTTTGGCQNPMTSVIANVSVYNGGNVDIDSAILHIRIDSASVTLTTITETTVAIAAGATIVHAFTTPYTVPNLDNNDSYSFTVYFDAISEDVNASNDSMSVDICVDDVSIDINNGNNWDLGQNQPNPAQNTTVIPYSIPQDGKVIFSIMSINGQLLYKESIQAVSGSNKVEIDINDLSNGIYYYSMEYNGQTIVKKMNVVK